ncbi:hypothetical protein ACFQGH_11200 [Halalkalicoccus tibetensis]|uniref:DUF8163 domain-containing protein n=2 Tax=Halalkalicoccus tibetensis TaxID=175632 RepID=A0ABD5V7Y3_9EURY
MWEKDRSLDEYSWVEFLPVLLAAVGFVFLSDPGLLGTVSATLIVGAWFALPMVYTVALGHVLVAALTVDGFTTWAIVTVELGLGGMILLATPALYGRRTVVSMIVFMLGLFVFTFGIVYVTSSSLWLGALALLIVGALASYGMHRYELVSLGLVEGSV